LKVIIISHGSNGDIHDHTTTHSRRLSLSSVENGSSSSWDKILWSVFSYKVWRISPDRTTACALSAERDRSNRGERYSHLARYFIDGRYHLVDNFYGRVDSAFDNKENIIHYAGDYSFHRLKSRGEPCFYISPKGSEKSNK